MSLAWLDRPLTTLAFCWRLDRRDGVSIGLTSHDRDLARDGLVYRASPGMTPSAISQSNGLEADTLDLGGALSGEAINTADLVAGRWDGASVRLFAVDWRDPLAPALPLARGTLGEVARGEREFTAELSGPTALLDRPVVELTSPDCRAQLGDRRCRVDLAPRMHLRRLAEDANGSVLRLDQVEPGGGAFAFGRLDWIDGANSGLSALIAASDGAQVTLHEAPPFAAAAGTRVRLVEGCDRRLATCAERFGNAVNFRGEPWLPGNDLLTRYPGT